MKDRIEIIFEKSKMQDADEADKKEMLALFHDADVEWELKGKLLDELNKHEIEDALSLDIKRVFEKLWAKIEVGKKQVNNKWRIVYAFTKVAAAVIIGLFVGYYVNSVLINNRPVYYTAHSPRGSISEVVMPDGTVICLNSDSQIKYSIKGNNGSREVFLSGEAWFEVQKDKIIGKFQIGKECGSKAGTAAGFK